MSSPTDRRVKIVATLGPAVAGREKLRDLLLAGTDMVRVNAAHGSPDERARLIDDVRAVASDLGLNIPILFDLKGLKIRTGPLQSDAKVPIARGSKVEIFPEPVASGEGQIGIDYPDLLNVIQPGSRLLISDGLIELLVEKIERDRAHCRVGRGGLLLARQGVTLPGAQIAGGALTPADREDIAFAVKHAVDFLGMSFVNDASDLVMARGVAQAYGADPPGLIAKIERPDALNNVYGIAQQANGLMVARGDLGVQLPPEQVPRAQKNIIACANSLGVPVITATQMLESMITQPMATRAETSDVANAVWDGTDAVMLSAETAVGLFPIEAVETMSRIIYEAERDGPIRTGSAAQPLPTEGDASLSIADSIARATYALSETAPVDHIVVFTLTGNAVRRVAKYRPRPPVIAVTTSEQVAATLNVVWGVKALIVPLETDPDKMFRIAGNAIIDAGMGTKGEHILIVGSLPMMKVAGKTNLLHIRRLGS
ncbi:MAG: pyruvate kinase [Thermomicrobiales bacterium]|nr:pyruvate kinase [Thermomicrobiales bacterium]